MKKRLLLTVLLLSLTACEGLLMTRSDVKEVEQKKQMQDQVVTLQRTTADTNNRFAEIEDDLRQLHGRIDLAENKLNQSTEEREKSKSNSEQMSGEQAKRIKLLEEEIGKMQEQIAQMSGELNVLKSAGDSGNTVADKSVRKDQFTVAEEFFQKKEWKRAILNYQKFRDANPRNKRFPEATYKIGVSFQELGLKDEAHTFFDEVISKFPNSAEAKKARTRLKSLKK